MHPIAQEGIEHPGAAQNLQHRGLQHRPPCLVVRRLPALHEARPDPVAQKFAGRKQPGGTGTGDQDRVSHHSHGTYQGGYEAGRCLKSHYH